MPLAHLDFLAADRGIGDVAGLFLPDLKFPFAGRQVFDFEIAVLIEIAK